MVTLKSLLERYINESKVFVSEDLKYHIDNEIPISNNVFRHGSKKFFDVIKTYFNLTQKKFVIIVDQTKAAEIQSLIPEQTFIIGKLIDGEKKVRLIA